MNFFIMRQEFKKDLRMKFKDSEESLKHHENRLNSIFNETNPNSKFPMHEI